MSKRLVLALCAVAAATGCANTNPLVSWDRSDATAAGQASAGALRKSPTDPLGTAKARAAALRSALEAKRAEQVIGTVNLNNGLLGLGILATGLALGNAHRDAYTVAAGLAGTAFLFGQQNLPKPRVTLYESGIKAVNCALRAVSPIDMGAEQHAQLVDDASALAKAQDALRTALANARARLDNARAAGLSAADVAPAQAQLDAVAKTGNAAVVTQGDVADLMWRLHTAGNELTQVVEAIGAQVNELVGGTVGDPANVPTLLAGLAAITGRFAPGLGVDTRISALGAAKSAGDGKAESAPSSPGAKAKNELTAEPVSALNNAVAQAERRAEQVDALQRPLAVRLAAFKGFASADALKSCEVSNLALQLVLSTSELSFKPGIKQGKSVLLSGGIKPYVARLRQTDGGGLEVKSPVPGDSNVEINVPASMTGPQELQVDVMDNASPRQLKTIVVTVEAPAADSTPQAAALADTSPSTTLRTALLAMQAGTLDGNNSVDFGVGSKAGANTYRIQSVAATATGVLVHVDCTRGSGGALDSVVAVRGALLARLVAPVNKRPYLPGIALPSNASALVVVKGVPAQRCIQ